jgi:hypothetical protein
MIHLTLFKMNIVKRSKQQWLELIQAQRASDLFIIDFCREQNLPLNNFYARRSRCFAFVPPSTDVKTLWG